MQSLVLRILLCSFLLLPVAVAAPATFPSGDGKHRIPATVPRPLYEGSQPFDIISYTLDIRLAMTSDALSGMCIMTLRLKRFVDSLTLNAAGLTFDSLRVDGVLRSYTMSHSLEQFTVRLGTLRNAGDTLHIAIGYHRTPGYPRLSARQGYYFFRDTIGIPSNLGYTFSEPSDARLWFPCYDEPWEKAAASMNITVPSGYCAASNGALLGTTDNGDGTVTWHWRESHQIATYLMCMTVSRFSISSLPFVRAPLDTVPLQYFTWPADSAGAASFLPTLHSMIQEFSRCFGGYPFDKYGMTSIVPFVYLGMEHQTLTTMNRYVQTDQMVVSHELAHQWWGDLVTCGTWSDIWLNEGFATYAEALWRESQGGFPALKGYMCDTLSRFQYASWQGAIYDPLGQGFNLFDQVVYSKAGWVLHTLRGVLGDSLFFRSLLAYRERYAGKSAVTAEFAGIVDSVCGTSLAWFFDQYIYGRGWPLYALRSGWSADTLQVTLYQMQSTSWPTFRMPITIRAYHGGDSTSFVVRDSMRAQTFRLPLSQHPDSVVLDPDGWILNQMASPPDFVDGEERPLAFELGQNYPNPFNPSTTVEFQVPVKSHVTLTLYDVLGRLVRTVVDETREAGLHTVVLDGRSLASGVYLYRLSAGQTVAVRKMIVVK
jgi:aminopeptidase N